LNRLDAIVRFGSLSRELIEQIVRLELAKVGRVLAEQDIGLESSDAAITRLANLGFDPTFGARPVKRVIQREVQDRLADMILAGELLPEQTVSLDVDDGEFTLLARARGGEAGGADEAAGADKAGRADEAGRADKAAGNGADADSGVG